MQSFCIGRNVNKFPSVLASDNENIEQNNCLEAFTLLNEENYESQQVPLNLIRGGHHFDETSSSH